MPTYRPGQVAELLGVSVDTVRRWTDSSRLLTARDDSGQRTIDGVDLARFLTETAPALEDAPVVARSSRNRLRGVVTKVVRDRVAATVEIQAGPHRMLSLMTAEAVDELGLEPGMVAIASVKSTNVVVELPDA
jgi:molybdopterin-binding protein